MPDQAGVSPKEPAISTVTLSLFRFAGRFDRLWVIGQMALARPLLRREPELRFFKLCGSGTGEGFTPRPNWQVWAILAVWPTESTARRAIAESAVWQGWSARAAEAFTLFLDPTTARGSWSGVNPFLPDGTPARHGPGDAAGPVGRA